MTTREEAVAELERVVEVAKREVAMNLPDTLCMVRARDLKALSKAFATEDYEKAEEIALRIKEKIRRTL